MGNDKIFTIEEKYSRKSNNNALVNAIEEGLTKKMQEQHANYLFAEVNTDFDYDEYRNALDSEMEKIDQEMHQLEQKRSLIDGWWKSIEHYRDALSNAYEEIERRDKKIEDLQLQIEKEKNKYEILSGSAKNMLEIAKELQNRKKKLEMQLAEMKKISEGMAKKASEEAMLKALRTYANTSKQKRMDKRAFAKTAILELANVNGLTLPPDLATTIDHLDDEQSDPKVVNVAGNYNDIHDNTTVNQK